MNIDSNMQIPMGFKFSGIYCGLKKNASKKDLALIYSEVPSSAAGVYTKNKVKGAPLTVSKNHLSNNIAQAIICNSGNANTCNGDDGIAKATETAEVLAKALNINTTDVLVASTGVIGVPLNVEKLTSGIPALVNDLSKDSCIDAASAIMTTDLKDKQVSVNLNIDGKDIVIYGMAKGSGMIEPNMATMLSFITTDLSISPELLQEALTESVNVSYNRISVDGDTSTNDMVLMLANGMANNTTITTKDFNYQVFVMALTHLNIELAKKIAQDGEGATKLIECIVDTANSVDEAVVLAKSVINSSLVKTAIFGSDANWGRILCALGYTDIDFDPYKVNVSFKSSAGSILVCKDGASVPFDEAKAKEILLMEEIQILIDMNMGTEKATCWGCDLSYEYVKINGDYRS